MLVAPLVWGDIVVGRRRVDRSSGEGRPTDAPWFAARATAFRVSPDREVVEPDYLLWALRDRVEEIWQGRVTGRMPATNDRLRQLELDLPGLAEQARLARLLEKADGLRQLRSRADMSRSRILPALYRRQFVIPDRSAWERTLLWDVAEPLAPGSSSQAGGGRDQGPLIVIVRKGFRCGDIEVVSASKKADDVYVLVPSHPRLDVYYLAEALRHADLRRYAAGSLRPTLSASALSRVEIFIPPVERQRRFSLWARSQKALDAEAAASSLRVDRLWRAVQAMAFNRAGSAAAELDHVRPGRGQDLETNSRSRYRRSEHIHD